MGTKDVMFRVLELSQFVLCIGGLVCVGCGIYAIWEGFPIRRFFAGIIGGLILIAAGIALHIYAPNILGK